MMTVYQNIQKAKVQFLTLGCRLNQYETQAMRENLLGNGYEETDNVGSADVCIVNTCTVTSQADRESRYLIRKCFRENPGAKIVVTGCYVERDQKKVSEMPGVTHVIFNRQKSDLANLLADDPLQTFRAAEISSRPKAEFVPLKISNFSGRTRACIKVQDGCNHACSFCKVILVRGKSRSRNLSEVVEEAKRLRDHGYREIVLTGVQLGAYGLDFQERIELSDVLKTVAAIDGIERIRLSSIEPTDVTDSLIETMRSLSKVCPHLPIPLQSGSDTILKAMNRRGNRDQYLRLIQKLREQVESFSLTTDVMVGFPGEADHDFEETVDLLLRAQPWKFHIFPYSPREGTRAFAWQPVPTKIVRERIDVLLRLEEKLRQDIQLRSVGVKVKILIEVPSKTEWFEGRTPNDLPVRIPISSSVKVGELVDVRISRLEEGFLVGHVVHHEC